jgi:hypothetical protein
MDGLAFVVPEYSLEFARGYCRESRGGVFATGMGWAKMKIREGLGDGEHWGGSAGWSWRSGGRI